MGSIEVTEPYTSLDLSLVESNPVRCPDTKTAEEMERLILDVKHSGDTIGGVVTCVVKGVPVGLGDPVFGRLNARLAEAMMSINASKGFEYGMGFKGVEAVKPLTVLSQMMTVMCIPLPIVREAFREAFPMARTYIFVWRSSRWRHLSEMCLP